MSDGFSPRNTSYVCPRDAIRLSGKGHTIDRTTCDLCAEWVDACPAEALQIMGRPVSASDLYTEMATDRPFGERSGGGVTLSGGEPLVQHRFVGAFLEICKDNYVHTAIESCLHASTEIIATVLPLVDPVIGDLKIMDDRQHRRFTGVSNALMRTAPIPLAADYHPVILVSCSCNLLVVASTH